MIEANILEFMNTARQYLLGFMPSPAQMTAEQGCQSC